MLNITDSTNIFLIPGPTDMRKGMDRLSLLVADRTKENVFSGALFIFCSRNRKTIKILYWDRNGFCLWQKKIDQEKFWWPKDVVEARKMRARELRWLLDGLDPTDVVGHKEFKFSTIF